MCIFGKLVPNFAPDIQQVFRQRFLHCQSFLDVHIIGSAVLLADGAEPVELDVPYPVDDFYDQIAHFMDLLRAGRAESPVMPLAATVRCAELLDAVRAKIAA